jgi:hypothetical protein
MTSCRSSSGTAAASSGALASPSASSAASVFASTFRSHGPGRSVTPRSTSSCSSLRRSSAATGADAAAWSVGAKSTGAVKRVRRMASIRTTVRSS